jgi:tetratricopeptide (TPR) repeat protein
VEALIQQGSSDNRAGDYAAAVKVLELARKKMASTPEMKGQEDKLLDWLGRAYMGERHLDDAIRTFALLLDSQMQDCRPGIADVELCAEAQQSIGYANLQKGNTEAAIPFLTRSMATYGRAAGEDASVEYSMITLKEQAEAEMWLAAAQVRSKHKDLAIDALRHAIDQLSKVSKNEEIQEAIRASARESLQAAQTALDRALKN